MTQRALQFQEPSTDPQCAICKYPLRKVQGKYYDVEGAHETCATVAREFIEAGKPVPDHVAAFMKEAA